jgi:hypothetical protein
LVNWNWMMKLKTNKILQKGQDKKNQKSKDWSWNTNNREGQHVIFREEREKKKKGSLWQTKSPPATRVTPIRIWYIDAFNNMMKGYF